MTEMTKQYKTATGWKVFILVAAPPLCGLFGWLAYTTLTAEPFNSTIALFMIPLSIGMILMFVLGIFDMFKSTLTFTKDGIKKVNLRGEKVLQYNQIKGIKSNENYVVIIPKDDFDKSISVSTYFGNKSEWHGLLLSKFPDLDTEEELKEEQELHKNETYGRTSEERNENISQTKQITKYINYSAWIISAWLWFYPRPYELATAAGVILPIIALILVFRSNGLIKIMDVKNSAYPSLSTTLSIPPMAIMIRVLYDYHILEYQNAWIYTIVAIPILLWLIIKGTAGEFKAKSRFEEIFNHTFLAVVIGIFVFFASISINCTFDESTPELYNATVLSKKVSKSGKGATSYLVTIGAWGNVKEETEVGVSKKQFERTEDGGTVKVYLNSGLLMIPWVYISTK
jgi:hypothetical protein